MDKQAQIKKKLKELILLFQGEENNLDMNDRRLGICLSVLGMHHQINGLEKITEILKREGNETMELFNKIKTEQAKLN